MAYVPTAEQVAADRARLDELRRRLNQDVDHVVSKYLPAARKDREGGKFYELGDPDGGVGQSLKINRADNKGIWTWFKGSPGTHDRAGDMLSLIVRVKYHGDFARAVRELRDDYDLASVTPEETARFAREARQRDLDEARKRASDIKAKASRAHHLWLGAVSIKGTPAQAYLENRGIDFGVLGILPGALRYRPDVKFCPIRGAGPDGTGYPAMLACVIASREARLGSGAVRPGDFLACHATFLDIDGWDHAARRGPVRVHKVVRAESVDEFGEVHYLPPVLLDPANPVEGKTKSHKATLGTYHHAGGYIPLRKGVSGKRLAAIPANLIPRFSEGIEDGLSYAQMGHLDDWIGAAVSLANMANLRMPAQAGGIAFLADRNDNEAADAAFEKAVAAQQEAFDDPAKVLAVWPRTGFSDFNNELRGVA